MNSLSATLLVLIGGLVLIGAAFPALSAESHWVRHVIHEGEQAMTAVAGDFPVMVCQMSFRTQVV